MNLSFSNTKAYKRSVWNFNNVNVNDLNADLLQVYWQDILSNVTNIDITYDKWFSLFNQLIKNIPHTIVMIRPRDKQWMNSKVRSAKRKRNRLLNKYCRSKSNDIWIKYKQQRNLTTTLIRQAKASFYIKLNKDLSDSSKCHKRWWSTTKALYNNKIQLSIPSIEGNNSIISDATQKAEVFNEYFVSQATVADSDRDIPPISLSVNPTSTDLASVQTSVSQVQNLIALLDVSKACGLDEIGNRIIKMCVPGILKPLTALFNLSLLRDELPREWKKPNVIPLFNLQDKTNYRPVSLLPSLSKLLIARNIGQNGVERALFPW